MKNIRLDGRDYLIGVLIFFSFFMTGVAISTSRTDAEEKIYKQCDSFEMYHDGSYNCKERNGYRIHDCVKDSECEEKKQ